MKIRHTLLISFLGISLASALLVSLMIFSHLREFIYTETEKKLQSQATTLMQQIDVTFFERLKNLTIWSRLEIMQDTRIRDIDKRLSSFLRDLQEGYAGVYQQLFVLNRDNEIIASSTPPLIGMHHVQALPWLTTQLNQQGITMESLDAGHQRLLLSIDLFDAFQTDRIGALYAAFDWGEILRLLQTPLLNPYLNAPAYAFLIDQDGAVIASSKAETRKTAPLITLAPENWLLTNQSGVFHTRIDALDMPNGLGGYACSQGYRSFDGFGWCVVILQPSEYAFAQISRLWGVILVFFTATLLLSVLSSLWLSEKFAQPIVKLAQFTRDFMLGEKVKFPDLKTSGEIKELSQQFSSMIQNLEQSRLDIVRVAKLAVVGEMAASMAHEVRTPLGILRSSAQLLEREPQLSAVGKELTGFILTETIRLNDLVTTLLECAKPRPPVFAVQNVVQIVRHAANLLQSQAEKKHVNIEILSQMHETDIVCDKDQLTQVFLNLMMNALQHAPTYGNITVILDNQKQSLHINICDDGPGVANEDKQAIFDPFISRRKGGVGLGLTVVQQIVLTHQGKIYVSDNQPKGACFHVILPYRKVAESQS